MEKKSIGKYFLVFEPKYVNFQFAVYFNSSNDVTITKIKKYTDVPYDGSTKPIKKNLLGDIDKIMTPLADLKHFFDSYIDPTIFEYSEDNLHKIFIGYKKNDRIYRLDCVIDNPNLNDKLKLIEGSKINDPMGRTSLIHYAVDTAGNSKFLSFASSLKKEYKTGLSSTTLGLLYDLRSCKISIESHSDSGMLDESISLSRRLNEGLTSYKEYRELYLLKMKYIENLEKEKARLTAMKDAVSSMKKDEFKFGTPYNTGEQLSIFGTSSGRDGYQKSKKK